jgi:hypothetical protein
LLLFNHSQSVNSFTAAPQIMVVTKLVEVTNKGKEWACGGAVTPTRGSTSVKSTDTNATSTNTIDDMSSFWNIATSSVQNAATSLMSSMVSSVYEGTDDPPGPTHGSAKEKSHLSSLLNPFSGLAAAPIITSRVKAFDMQSGDEEDEDGRYNSNSYYAATPSLLRRSGTVNTSHSPWKNKKHSDLVWMFRNDKNPFNAVRGHGTQTSSMTAVRSLVALVPTKDDDYQDPGSPLEQSDGRRLFRKDNRVQEALAEADEDESESTYLNAEQKAAAASSSSRQGDDTEPLIPPPPYALEREGSLVSSKRQRKPTSVTPSETASQLAEGTIRALRDLALDEAVELQTALRYWNSRWERPLLSWLEAGPLGELPYRYSLRVFDVVTNFVPCVLFLALLIDGGLTVQFGRHQRATIISSSVGRYRSFRLSWHVAAPPLVSSSSICFRLDGTAV